MHLGASEFVAKSNKSLTTRGRKDEGFTQPFPPTSLEFETRCSCFEVSAGRRQQLLVKVMNRMLKSTFCAAQNQWLSLMKWSRRREWLLRLEMGRILNAQLFAGFMTCLKAFFFANTKSVARYFSTKC
jgi:hypothetical protein